MSEEGSILIPVEQKQVLFYEDEITAVRVTEAGRPVVYVPLRPICDYLGVSWSGQRDRTVRDPVLKTEVRGVRVTYTRRGRRHPGDDLPAAGLPQRLAVWH